MPLLDVVLGYDCNLKCTYCTITDAMRRRSIASRDVVRELERARRDGFDSVAFTGGEPTIFPQLPALVRRARALGFDSVKIASNGLRYADARYLRHLLDAGVTVFHVSMHAPSDRAYELTVQRAETAALRRRALENLVAAGVSTAADLILKTDTAKELDTWIANLRRQGMTHFNLWLVSLTDENAGKVDQLPRIEDLAPIVARACDAAAAEGYVVESLHIPRCFLPQHEAHVRHPGSEGVRVVTPDSVFDLRDSRLTGGVKADACAECRHNAACPGLRPDYVEVHGSGGLRAIT